MKKKIRRMGDITLDLEPLLEELIDDHDLQYYEVLALVRGWLETHRPNAIEEYLDGTHPVYQYTHREVKK